MSAVSLYISFPFGSQDAPTRLQPPWTHPTTHSFCPFPPNHSPPPPSSPLPFPLSLPPPPCPGLVFRDGEGMDGLRQLFIPVLWYHEKRVSCHLLAKRFNSVMDRRIIDGLINSVSRFIHLVTCLTVKSTPVLKDFRNLVGVLKPLRALLDEYLYSQMRLDEELFKAFEDLDMSVNEVQELLEKLPQKTSTIYNVLRCGPLLMKVQRSVMEVCCCLRNLLELSPCSSLSACVQHCIQELQCADQDQMSELIEFTLKGQNEKVITNQQYIMKIANSLGLISSKELLMESIALEKDREKAERMKKKEDVNLIYQIIDLVKQIKSFMVKTEQLGLINGFSVPSYFRCPLSLELMLDPVILASGQTYERYFIQKWLDHGIKICPMTCQTLFHTNLVPNYTVKALIANWCDENGIQPSNIIGANQVPYLQSPPMISEAVGNGNGFCGTMNFGPAAKTSHNVENEHEDQSDNVSSQNHQEEDPNVNHHLSVPHVVTFRYNPSIEQQPYSHCRSDSVSSVNSTTELLSKSENRTILSEVPGNRDISPWLSSSQSHFSKLGIDDDHGKLSSPIGSGSDVIATTCHIQKLIEDLKSQSNELQTTAALELRLLAKHNMENRIQIAKCGAILPLISLLYSKVKITQENAVTALLNLSIYDNNKTAIAEAGAMEPLIHVLKCGNTKAKENSAAALFSLSVMEEYKMKIGRSDAVKALVDLLGSGTIRGKKDATAALFNLSIFHENKARIIQAGAVRHLAGLLDPETGMIDRAVALLANLSTIPEGRLAITQEGGIPLLVEVVESGSQRGKENAASVLLQLCINSPKFCSIVLQEGAVPPLIALTQNGTPRAKEKAQQILGHFRSQRGGALGKGRS